MFGNSYMYLRKYINIVLFFLVFLLPCVAVVAQQHSQQIIIDSKSDKINLNAHAAFCLEDAYNNIDSFIASGSKTCLLKKIIVFPLHVSNAWVQFEATNKTDERIYLEVNYANITSLKLYKHVTGRRPILIGIAGNEAPIDENAPTSADYFFDIKLPKDSTAKYYLHVESKHPIILPISLTANTKLIRNVTIQTFIMGLYFGILGIMFLYNLFVYVFTRDRNYIYYIFYIFVLAVAQATSIGYAYRYFWPGHSGINQYAVIATTAAASIAAMTFAVYFLDLRNTAPFFRKMLFAAIIAYLAAILLGLWQQYIIAYHIINYVTLIGGIGLFIISLSLAINGSRPALFFMIAWGALLLAVIVVVMRNLGWLPFTTLTQYALYFGSGLEVSLLSVALADKINTLQKEKQASQQEALEISKEKEKIVKEQNVMLEAMVQERTEELQASNEHLSEALNDLKDAQTQLVEAEKMASLGQLTAGIAHEINNPINFVKSNIKPLRLDLKDIFSILDAYEKVHHLEGEALQNGLKVIAQERNILDVNFLEEEIYSLIQGIEEGAERTGEIVKGLRTFSRLDESEIKTVNIHDGLDSTIVLLRNNIPFHVKIIKDYKAVEEIECYPGKLNQVFMNIISNAIQAIAMKPVQTDNEFIKIATYNSSSEDITIAITDTGNGMTPEVKRKIFEPFFTTKDVGEGTGLGLAIVFKIIQKHFGKISVESEPGKGATFIITLPVSLSKFLPS